MGIDSKMNATQIKTNHLWKGEHHFHPQMLFLWNRNFEYFPFDFIGELKEFDVALKMILSEFSDYLYENPDKYELFVKHLRDRTGDKNPKKYRKKENYADATKREYFINREDLSDADIAIICEVYFLDYICMPFDIPIQCDIESMFEKYYDRFITYNDCYFS